MKKEYNFIYFHDAGHGWLRVPLRLLQTLGIQGKVSSFSYEWEDSREEVTYVYLEEDCDMPLFMRKATEEGYKINIKEQYCGRVAQSIRQLRSYKPKGEDNETT